MKCPRCDDTVLDERDRDGVTVDSCPRCRGVWLDRGELEKLITRAIGEIEGEASPRAADPRHGPPPEEWRRRRDDDDDDDDDWEDRRRHGAQAPRKKSWFHSLRDLVD